MKKQLFLLAVLIASVSIFGFLGLTEKKDVLAKVGRKSITRDDVQLRINSYPEQYREALSQEENMPRILEQIVNEETLILAAQKEGISTHEDFQKEVEDQKRELIINRILDVKVNNIIKVTDQEVEQFFQQNQAQFGELETRRAKHILVEDEATARNLLRQVRNGGNFETLAKNNSTDPTAQNGGDLGFFRRGQLVKPFEDVAFELKKGQVSNVVKTEYGYHIIKLEEINVRPKIEFADVKENIKSQLLSSKRREASQQLLETIKSDLKVKVFADKLSNKKDVEKDAKAAQTK